MRYLDALRSDYYMDYASLNASIIVFILFLVFLVVYTTCPSIVRDRILSTSYFLALAFIVILITTFKIFHCYFHRSICGSNMCQSKPWGINNTSWKNRLTKSGVELYIKVYNNHYVIGSRSDLSHRCYLLNIFLRIKELTFAPNLSLIKTGSCSLRSLMIASSIKKGNKKYITGTFWIANTLSIAITR